jgi:tRNA (cytidine/uridine-2'-O-)-methyltransferase
MVSGAVIMIHVILFQPEIPQNTGNIMRTCAATGATLHIIGPLPFAMNDRALHRAGMDYLSSLEWFYYDSLETFFAKNPMANDCLYCATRYGKIPHSSMNFKEVDRDYYVIFGRESTGLPPELLQTHLDTSFRIPMKAHARSLNLSNTVAIVVYEILRQMNYYGLSTQDHLKSNNPLNQ